MIFALFAKLSQYTTKYIVAFCGRSHTKPNRRRR